MAKQLGDDELTLILNRVTDPNDRRSFSEICKQWLRVEGLNRSSIRLLEPDLLLRVLPRFPNLAQFETSKFLTDADLEFVAQTCPEIETLNLNFKPHREFPYQVDEVSDKPRHVPSGKLRHFDVESVFDDFGDEGLCFLASGCPKLCKVLLRRRKNIGDLGIASLVDSSRNLTRLDLGFCSLVSDEALEAIGSANSIEILCLQGCSLITDRGLGFLGNGSCSEAIKRLNLSECDRITDFGVSLLRQMGCLEELNLAECGPKVTDTGTISIAEAIKSMKNVNFSWLVNVSDPTLVALAENCPNLEWVNLTGCEMVTGAGLRAFEGHLCLEALLLRYCFNVGVIDVEYTVYQCWSLKTVVLDKRLKIWMSPHVQERMRRLVNLVWC